MNTAFSRLFGYEDKNKLFGKRLQDVVPPDLLPSFIEGDIDLRKRFGHEGHSIQIYDSNKQVIQYQVEKSAVSNEETGHVFIFGVILTECPENYPKKHLSHP